MKKNGLIVLLTACFAGQALSQKLHTSLYLCPVQAVAFPLPNYRFSFEQSFTRKLALFADYSLYNRRPAVFKDFDGNRADFGLKYFYKSGLEQGGNYKNLFWYSVSYGYEKQRLALEVFDREKNVVFSTPAVREAQHFNVGSGVSLVYKHWNIDLGLRLGLKKRDVDFPTYTEIQDDSFEIRGTKNIRRTFATQTQYLPDLLLLFRLGYSLFYF